MHQLIASSLLFAFNDLIGYSLFVSICRSSTDGGVPFSSYGITVFRYCKQSERLRWFDTKLGCLTVTSCRDSFLTREFKVIPRLFWGGGLVWLDEKIDTNVISVGGWLVELSLALRQGTGEHVAWLSWTKCNVEQSL